MASACGSYFKANVHFAKTSCRDNHHRLLRQDNDDGFLGERIKGVKNSSNLCVNRSKKAKPSLVSAVLTSNNAQQQSVVS